MRMVSPVRLALFLFVSSAATAAAQQGSGQGFLFRPPPATFTFYGGLAAPFAKGGVHELATTELTLDRGDFRSGSFGADLAFTVSPRVDVVLSLERARSQRRSEYRDWVDNNDLPIEQSTRFERTPLIASVRYFFAERGRRVGSVAWIPAQFVPFVSGGIGTTRYNFEQTGDFLDQQTLNIFTDRLTSKGWALTMSAGAGAQWNLNQRFLLTGEAKYLRASGNGDAPSGEFSGYKVDLSGVSTLIGITVRF